MKKKSLKWAAILSFVLALIIIIGSASQAFAATPASAEKPDGPNKGKGIKIGILDTGIDLDHPDLNVVDDVSFVPGTTSGDDDHGHGTLVAGIIAALDNYYGAVGIAPEAELYAIKVLNENGGGAMSHIRRGIEWAIDNDMDVLNISFGSVEDWPYSLKQALRKAYASGMVIVAGAGNKGTPDGRGNTITAPARYDTVIAVGAVDMNYQRLSSSATGDELELVAPGHAVYSTLMGGSYGTINKTSAASAHVAGTAALLIAENDISNTEVRQTLQATAFELGTAEQANWYGYGMVNAFGTVLSTKIAETTDSASQVVSIEFDLSPRETGSVTTLN